MSVGRTAIIPVAFNVLITLASVRQSGRLMPCRTYMACCVDQHVDPLSIHEVQSAVHIHIYNCLQGSRPIRCVCTDCQLWVGLQLQHITGQNASWFTDGSRYLAVLERWSSRVIFIILSLLQCVICFSVTRIWPGLLVSHGLHPAIGLDALHQRASAFSNDCVYRQSIR